MTSPRVLILLALCVLPALLVEARPLVYPYHVHGRVYCDTCRLGCEHELVTYIKGAVVKIVCYDETKTQMTYTRNGVTDEFGRYVIEVRDDKKDDFCYAVLVSSPQTDCDEIIERENQVTAVLTEENGVVSHERKVNSLGAYAKTTAKGCPRLAKLFSSEDV